MGKIDQGEIILRGRMDGKQRNRLKRLLDMEYRPSELADEVGFAKSQIYRVYVPLDCPHRKDDHGRLWLNGKEFKIWFEELYKKRKLDKDQAFCLTCKKPVKMVNPNRKEKNGLAYYLCNCPVCGRKISRIIDLKKRGND